MKIMVTGGAGFIGSAVCRQLVADDANHVVNVDKLTYAGNLESLRAIENRPNYDFVEADIADEDAMNEVLATQEIEAVMHLAAESHVDRSIDGPDVFVETNVVGTCRLLSAARRHFESLSGEASDRFRFHHVSTDEVYGDLPFES
ncbi:MAG: SDR family NAD(P)-dependent oxidoreductase, partial [Pseudomonadota bacterium]